MIHSRDEYDPVWAIKQVLLLHEPVPYTGQDGMRIRLCVTCGEVAPCGTMAILDGFIDDYGRGS